MSRTAPHRTTALSKSLRSSQQPTLASLTPLTPLTPHTSSDHTTALLHLLLVAHNSFLTAALCAAARCVSLTFPFYMYGEPYTTVYIGSNGNLNFGVQSLDDSYDFLPIATYDAWTFLPVFAPFNGAFNVANTSTLTWSTETLAVGQRAAVIRYTNIPYTGRYGDNVYNNSFGNAMSMDVLLYETPVGRIDVRYYRIDVDEANEFEFQIGMQSSEGLLGNDGEGNSGGSGGNYYSDDYSVMFLPFNYLSIDATAQSRLQGNTLTFNFTGLLDNNSTICGGLGYDFRNVSAGTLVYWDKNDDGGNQYFLQLCGAVTKAECAAALNPQGYRPMICQASVFPNGTISGNEYALAVYNPNAIYWQYLINGVRATIQDGQICQGITSQPRVSILNFVCDPTAVTLNITGYSEFPTCTYNFNITSNIACGNGSRLTPTGVLPSTLTACQNITGAGYTAVWCPRPFTSSAAYTPQQLPNLVINENLANDDGSDTIEIGFNVNMYGTGYGVMAIDSNGLISFGPITTTVYLPQPFPDLGLNTNTFPLVAPLWVDMNNGAGSYSPASYSGFIGTSLEGDAPNRQFFVRFSNVDYYADSHFAVPGTATFDVVFYENDTKIETRYYGIAPNPSSFDTLAVGMHGQNSSVYTAVQNAPFLTAAVAGRLSYTTITYYYTGKSEAEVCGGGVFPQLINIPDLVLTSGSSRFWLKPCGLTTTSLCLSGSLATQAASVCQVKGTTISSLATDNPTATQWIVLSNTSVRSVTQDGAYSYTCNGSPKVIVDYLCQLNATTAFLNSVNATACTYSFVVYSSLLCGALPPTSSSSSAAPSFSSSSSTAAAVTPSTAAATSAPVVQPTSAVSPPVTSSTGAATPSSSSSSSSPVAAGGDTSNSGGGSSLSGGAIAGIVIGSVVGALLLCFLLTFLVCRGGKRGDKQMNGSSKESSEASQMRTDDYEGGSHEVELQHVDP